MYQSFSVPSHKLFIKQRVTDLRERMKKHDIQGYFIPREDAFQGEYVPDCSERLAYISGFTGSAGLVLVTLDKAFLFVDGRYTIQAPLQTDTNIFTVVCTGDKPLSVWFQENLTPDTQLAYDPTLFTVSRLTAWQDKLTDQKITLVPLASNLVDDIWTDRPHAPETPVYIYPQQLAGLTVHEKINLVCQKMKEKKADYLLLMSPENLCWLLNVRASDVPHTPFVLSYGLLKADGTLKWFVDKKRINQDLKVHLGENILVQNLDDFISALLSDELSGQKVWIDPHQTHDLAFSVLKNNDVNFIQDDDPCTLLKACKTLSEQNAMRKAHIHDGVAVCRFLAWLDQQVDDNVLPTEIECVKKLEQCRVETGKLKEISFDTISGSGPHGAIVHYRVTEETDRQLQKGEFFLLDSGGQYLEGTTDITRTIPISDISSEMKDRFTRVLQGHIDLASIRWPHREGASGLTGANLDALTRRALWSVGLDYDHGTGHGVGCFLSVHEGPQGISLRSKVPLQAGMILSNEPGFYKEGEYGIRTENVILVKEPQKLNPDDSEERPMMSFETLTLVPIDTRAVDVSLLSSDQKAWLNAYHAQIAETIMPLLHTDTEKAWLSKRVKVC